MTKGTRHAFLDGSSTKLAPLPLCSLRSETTPVYVVVPGKTRKASRCSLFQLFGGQTDHQACRLGTKTPQATACHFPVSKLCACFTLRQEHKLHTPFHGFQNRVLWASEDARSKPLKLISMCCRRLIGIFLSGRLASEDATASPAKVSGKSKGKS